MCTSTMIKLVRWRVRDLAACFFACRLPIDCSTSTDQGAKKRMVFDPIGESRRRENSRQKLRRKKKDQERASFQSSKQTTNRKTSAENGVDESSWPLFSEEDFIVFCFKDDGAIHMIKEKRSPEASYDKIHHGKISSRAVNKMIQNFDESAQKTSISSPVNVINRDDKDITSANEEDTTLADEQIEEEGSNDVEVGEPPDEIKGINHIEGKSSSSLLSAAESSDSTQSDASTGSFAFPILGWEWMGSPVHMPKPEDIHFRKQKARCVRLHCCRF